VTLKRISGIVRIAVCTILNINQNPGIPSNMMEIQKLKYLKARLKEKYSAPRKRPRMIMPAIIAIMRFKYFIILGFGNLFKFIMKF